MTLSGDNQRSRSNAELIQVCLPRLRQAPKSLRSKFLSLPHYPIVKEAQPFGHPVIWLGVPGA